MDRPGREDNCTCERPYGFHRERCLDAAERRGREAGIREAIAWAAERIRRNEPWSPHDAVRALLQSSGQQGAREVCTAHRPFPRLKSDCEECRPAPPEQGARCYCPDSAPEPVCGYCTGEDKPAPPEAAGERCEDASGEIRIRGGRCVRCGRLFSEHLR